MGREQKKEEMVRNKNRKRKRKRKEKEKEKEKEKVISPNISTLVLL